MYKHIKRDDRICIALMLKQEHTYTEIAKELDFHRTTILREIKRNNCNGIYRVAKANKLSKERRLNSKVKKRIIENNSKLRKDIHRYLKKDFSPEQITGLFGFISHMTIYRYINRSSPKMKKYLRRQGKKRRKYGTKANLSRYQANKRSIHSRPIYNEIKGHWEGDTIVGKERNLRIITYVDRFSGYLIAGYSTAKADDIHLHAKNNFKSKPCLTITYDNGSEFALHQMIERDTSALVYFADKGKPQQRGANENINGLLRQYFPKGSSFATITNRDVQRAVRKLNNRPRKRLNYLTPRQVFNSASQELI